MSLLQDAPRLLQLFAPLHQMLLVCTCMTVKCTQCRSSPPRLALRAALCGPSCMENMLPIQLIVSLAINAVHGPKDATPSEELVAIAAASAAAAAAHTTQMSQGSHGHPGQAGQLAQQPGMASLQQEQQQRDSPARLRPGQADAEALNRLSRLQQSQPPQV